jgi:hypothetical protein
MFRLEIHLIECNGFDFEVATKVCTKKLDLIGEVCLLNQAGVLFLVRRFSDLDYLVH